MKRREEFEWKPITREIRIREKTGDIKFQRDLRKYYQLIVDSLSNTPYVKYSTFSNDKKSYPEILALIA
jgi:hypothetical protein